jgi:hypothetical protein
MSWALFPAVQRAWSVVAAGLRDEMITDAHWRAREEPSIVAALCTCVLGEREGSPSASWPPQSVAELIGRSGGRATGMTRDAGLLRQGLDALDDLALWETQWRFAPLDRRTQLRLLFQLETGRGRLSRRHASAFIDAFLTLAAQAYLCDALPQTHLPLPLDTP